MNRCSPEAWQGLWSDFNRYTTPVIRINRAHLREVVECHGPMPDALVARVPRTGSETVEVYRPELFKFLIDHARTCQ